MVPSPEDGITNANDLHQFDRHGGDEYHMDIDPADAGMPPSAETPDHVQQDRAPFIECFQGMAGTPISDMGQSVPTYQALHDDLGTAHIWHPFQLQCNWEFARWAKNRGPSLTSVTELLAIDGVVESLGLSYHTTKELNRIIDKEMPGRPKFKCEEVQISGESYNFHFWEIIPCLRVLFGDPRFQSTSHSHQNVIFKMWDTPCRFSAKCTPVNGGGQCSDPLSHTDQA
ncbi:hypothetical protein EI94DRAFT_1812979 [Lactarius quietus]|nr:hypothetical protein EI94DRAFT_1812979 [Lactarius quietus]